MSGAAPEGGDCKALDEPSEGHFAGGAMLELRRIWLPNRRQLIFDGTLSSCQLRRASGYQCQQDRQFG
jgi:hypothetical protein